MLQKAKKIITTITFITVLGFPLTGFSFNTAVIDINNSSRVELQNIKGIGPTMATKIVNYRSQSGRFAQVADLCQVRGIGTKSLQKMAHQMCVK